jgi:hypothetical protein
MRDVLELLGSNAAVGGSLAVLEVVANIPKTAVGYAIVSRSTMRPRKYRKLCAAAGMNPTDWSWGYLGCLDASTG